MIERLRLLFWRHRRGLAVAWLSGLGLVSLLVLLAPVLAPREIDVGFALALRARAYHRTFAPVLRARAELEDARADRAAVRLERFLERYGETQSAHLETHAVVEAHLLLSETWAREDRTGRAARLLEHALRIEPLDHRIWWQLARIRKARGELAEAEEAVSEAFRLALNHAGIAELYIQVLVERGRPRRVLWVADQFRRASVRGRPSVEVRVGGPRGRMQRRALDWAGIPVEQGRYTGSLELHGLERGSHRSLHVPDAMLRRCRPDRDVMIQLAFEQVYDGLVIEALRWTSPEGESREWIPPGERIGQLHRPGSGASWIVEIDTGVRAQEMLHVELVYSCPVHDLSADTLRLIDTAGRQVAAEPRS